MSLLISIGKLIPSLKALFRDGTEIFGPKSQKDHVRQTNFNPAVFFFRKKVYFCPMAALIT